MPPVTTIATEVARELRQRAAEADESAAAQLEARDQDYYDGRATAFREAARLLSRRVSDASA